MSEQKNNNLLCWLKKVRLALGILAIVVGVACWVAIKITAATTEIDALQTQQANLIKKDVFEAHLIGLDKRLHLIENQLDRIEDFLKERK